jgi:pimeloyl-ACP methyl ester carboxylesterase
MPAAVTNSAGTHVTIEGCRLEYERYLPRSRNDPTIVFLHEGLGSVSRWRDFPAAVCARTGFAGLVYNRCGYGGSDRLQAPFTPNFMHREALEVLPRLLSAFRIERPILFGHSDGAAIALLHAASHPVSALIVEAPHVFVEDVAVSEIAKLKASYGVGDFRERLARHQGTNVDTLFNAWTGVWLSDAFRGWNIEDALPRISCPTLVIQGTDDEYGTPRQVAAMRQGLDARMKTLVLDSCRHTPHIDQRATVEDAAVMFLEQAVNPQSPDGTSVAAR